MRQRIIALIGIGIVLLIAAIVRMGPGLVAGPQLTTTSIPWDNWSWGSTVVSSGGLITVTPLQPYGGLFLHHASLDITGDTTLFFGINGLAGGQRLQVVLEDANDAHFASPVALASFIGGGVVPTNQWRAVAIPLGALGFHGTLTNGFFLQDMTGTVTHMYEIRDVHFGVVGATPVVSPVASPTVSPVLTPALSPSPTTVFLPTVTVAPTGTAVPTIVPTATPQTTNFGSSPPFALGSDESYQSKGAEQWLPVVKAAVNDAVMKGLLNQNERQLWENIVLGQIDVESTGHVFLVGGSDPHYSLGLTQNAIPWLEYAEENPFDPLMNLRGLLRTEIRYYRKWGNRWDRAVGEYLTGSEDPTCQQTCGDGNTTGLSYFERVVNAVWWVQYNHAHNLNYPPQDNAYQANISGWFGNAPTWAIWGSPNLAYNWVPPSNQNGYNYYTQGVDAGIAQPIATNTWLAAPGWFYGAAPEPGVLAYPERAPTSLESQQNPPGRTIMTGTSSSTYPRRQWSVTNP